MGLFNKGILGQDGDDPLSILPQRNEEAHDKPVQPTTVGTPTTETMGEHRTKIQTVQMTEYVPGLVQRSRTKIASENTHCAPDLPAKKVSHAIEKYAPTVRPEDILVLIDTTVFGSGKEGALITRDRIYTYWGIEGRHSFLFTEITSVDFDPGSGKLWINGKVVISTISRYRNQMVLIVDLLRQISVIFNRPDCQDYLADLMSQISCHQCGAPLTVFVGDTLLVCQACGTENHLSRGATQSAAMPKQKSVGAQVGNEITLLGNIAWDVIKRTSAQLELDSRTLISARITLDILQSALGESAESLGGEQVIVLMQDSLSGGSQDGLLLTDKRVYEFHRGRLSKSIRLDEITEVSLSFPPGSMGCLELNGQPFFTAFHLPPKDVGFIAGALLTINKEVRERQSDDELIKINSREPQEIIAAFKRAIKDESIFLSPDIPAEKLKNALSHYGSVKEEDVLALVDCTNNGSAKANLTLTCDRISFRRDGVFEQGRYLELREIRSVESDKRPGVLYVDGSEVIDTRREASAVRMLALMIEELCRTLHPAENPLVVDEEWPGVDSLEQVRATTCYGCGSPLDVRIRDIFLRCQYCRCERLVVKSMSDSECGVIVKP